MLCAWWNTTHILLLLIHITSSDRKVNKTSWHKAWLKSKEDWQYFHKSCSVNKAFATDAEGTSDEGFAPRVAIRKTVIQRAFRTILIPSVVEMFPDFRPLAEAVIVIPLSIVATERRFSVHVERSGEMLIINRYSHIYLLHDGRMWILCSVFLIEYKLKWMKINHSDICYYFIFF